MTASVKVFTCRPLTNGAACLGGRQHNLCSIVCMARSDHVRNLLVSYSETQLAQVQQTAACKNP
jgi:hypothetical protein